MDEGDWQADMRPEAVCVVVHQGDMAVREDRGVVIVAW